MEKEEKIVKMLAECWNEFLQLEQQHPDERRDFCNGIYRCQDVIGMRFARESRPDLFPIKGETVTYYADGKLRLTEELHERY